MVPASPDDLRSGLLTKLRLLQAYAQIPDKMPELLELYRSAPPDGFDDLIVRQIAELFECDPDTAGAINDLQFRYLHPHYQKRIAEEIEVLRSQLDEL